MLLTSFSDDFTGATSANLVTTAYKSLPGDASKPMYLNVNSTASAEDGVLTLGSNRRFAIGARATTATTSSSTPGGVFDVFGKSCTLTLNYAEAGAGSGNFQVFIDNNTTSSSASYHGNASRIRTGAASAIVAGQEVITFSLTKPATWPANEGSFIAFRAESSVTSVKISDFALSCN